MENALRKSLLNRDLTLGAWVQIGHAAVGELFARAGFDWICVDLEHGPIDLESMASMFRAISGTESIAVARLPANDPVWIHRSLDAGAQALIIPMVNTAEEAEMAISEAKYPPRGRPGFGYSRANSYGRDFDTYVRSANDEIAMIMQIEHKDAIRNINEILQVDGVDGVFIGPYDLSGSMGITGQFEHPEMKKALDAYRAACREHKVSAGMHIVRPSEQSIASAIRDGYTLIALGLDTVFLDEQSTRYLKMARDAGGK